MSATTQQVTYTTVPALSKDRLKGRVGYRTLRNTLLKHFPKKMMK